MRGKNELLSMEKREEIVRQKAEKRKYPRRNQKQKSPFRVRDVVQHQLPKTDYKKGQSPKSRPMRIISQVSSRWDFRLSDGQVWNARSLFRYRPSRFWIHEQLESEDELPEPITQLRRSTRTNAGRRKPRFIEEF